MCVLCLAKSIALLRCPVKNSPKVLCKNLLRKSSNQSNYTSITSCCQLIT